MKHLTFLIYTLHSITFSQFIEQPSQEIDKEYHENGSLSVSRLSKTVNNMEKQLFILIRDKNELNIITKKGNYMARSYCSIIRVK